jgi:C1A family cysteine protease
LPNPSLGALPSLPDSRDHDVARYMPATMPVLPTELDLRPLLQPVRNQGNAPTCVALAIASGRGGYDEKTASPSLDRQLSPADLYANGRILSPVPNGGGGMYMRSALDVYHNQGISEEGDRPYFDTLSLPAGPNAAAHRAQNRIAAYAAADKGISAAQAALVAHGPMPMVVTLHQGFVDLDAGHRVSAKGDVLGSHGVLLVGYRNSQRAWLVRNSWGTGWGDGGYAWLDYDYVLDELWAIITAAILSGQPHASQWPWLAQIAQMLGLHIPGLD